MKVARVDLWAFERNGQFGPAVPAILSGAAERGSGEVADEVARSHLAVARRELRAQAESAVGLGVDGHRVACGPGQETGQARAAQARDCR